MAPRPIIYINSYPGVGKHTIARALKDLLHDEACVVHNHLHIDLAGALLPRTSLSYQSLRRDLRSALFKTLIASPDTYGKSYIFTDCQSTSELESSVAQEYADMAKSRGCAFIPIILECDEWENSKRIRSSERVELVEKCGKGMLLDGDILAEIRESEEIYRFGCSEEMLLDVTELGPETAAEMIRRHIGDVVTE